jgi:GT2 family glycosyltransferase
VSAPISVVIVNFNGERVIGPCLDSVFAQSCPPAEVIVVDNASTDGSCNLVRRIFPSVKVIASPVNHGYAGGCNLGIRACSQEFVAILNNDVVLDPGWAEAMMRHLDKPFAFWASLVVFAYDPRLVDSAGDGMAVIGAGYKRGHGQPASRYDREEEVFGACAAAALYRRSMLDEISGFDEDFFLIYEDADLNLRARLRGHRCLYVPSARVIHHVNASIRTFSHTYVFFGHRNSEYVFWKNMPASMLVRFLPERLLFDLASFLFFLFKGRTGSFLQAKLSFLRNVPSVVRKRRTIQKQRQLTTSQLRALLDRNWLRFRRKAVMTR